MAAPDRIIPGVSPKTGKIQGYLTPGNPGNKGGGRPPNELRAKMREGLDKALDLVMEMIKHPEALTGREVIALNDFLAKYSIGTASPESATQQMEAVGTASKTVYIDSDKI